MSDYVKPANGDDDTASNTPGNRVVRVGQWLCNRELLQWRLERNVFPELSLEPLAFRMGAELSKLTEPVLTRVYAFLQAADFVHITQTNKVWGLKSVCYHTMPRGRRHIYRLVSSSFSICIKWQRTCRSGSSFYRKVGLVLC